MQNISACIIIWTQRFLKDAARSFVLVRMPLIMPHAAQCCKKRARSRREVFASVVCLCVMIIIIMIQSARFLAARLQGSVRLPS